MRIMAALGLLLLSGCYTSPSDLLAGHEATITDFSPIVAFNRQSYYFRGAGKKLDLCQLKTRSDLTAPCSATGVASLERTRRGNYIVQIKSLNIQSYGIWFRTDTSSFGRAGFQCFAWLGDGIVGKRAVQSVVALQWGRSEIFQRISERARAVAVEPTIDRAQLLKLVEIYESELSPLDNEVTCLGSTVEIPPATARIVGDNRHLKDFES